MGPVKGQLIFLAALLATPTLDAVQNRASRAGDLMLGEREPGDSLIISGQTRREGGFGQANASFAFDGPGFKYINYIYVTNRAGQENTGYAKILEGGIGQTKLKIGLFGQPGQALYFGNEVYAVPLP